MAPKGKHHKTLIVTFNQGPHAAATTEYDGLDQLLAEMGVASLKVNPRGSAGMGDQVLQAIVGNVGEVHSAYFIIHL